MIQYSLFRVADMESQDKKNNIARTVTLLLLLFLPLCGYAEDLLSIYVKAYHCDPVFKAAYARMLSTRENVPINRALLLPRIDLHAEATEEKIDLTGRGVISNPATNNIIGVGNLSLQNHAAFNNTIKQYILVARQPLFNLQSFEKLKQAKVTARAAEAKFCAAAQDLVVRVGRAYFDVLKAYDLMMIYTEEERSLQNLLNQTQMLLNVRLVPVTSFNEVQARRDQVTSAKLAAEIEMLDKLEDLEVMIGCVPGSLKGVFMLFPMAQPEPASLSCWVEKALQQNFDLMAANLNAIAACQNVKVQAAGHTPVINATGEYIYEDNSNPSDTGRVTIKELLGTVSMDLPIYHGGEINAKTRQAAYDYQEANAERQRIMLSVISDTRKSLNHLHIGCKKIIVDREAIASNARSLATTMESYRAGIRTILDVLDSQTQYSQVQITYTRDVYEYLLHLILLKKQTGTVCFKDLDVINTWLTKEICLKPYLCE